MFSPAVRFHSRGFSWFWLSGSPCCTPRPVPPEKFFGPEVTEPVRMHVMAKRYLVATDPDYAAALSPSSVRSLAVQGGPMSAEEQAAFAALPGFAAATQVRRYDDLGKDPERVPRPFRAFVPLLERLARR